MKAVHIIRRVAVGLRGVFALVVVMGIIAGVAHAATPSTFSGKLNLNTATAAELEALPGIGASKSEAIIAYRSTTPFKTAEELLEVKGIGPKLFESLKEYVKVDGVSDLHASEAVPAGAQGALQKTAVARP